jgi:hypothetical protein
MAILDDDFQSYAIGATMPFGSWIWNGLSAPQIVSEPGGTGIPGTDRSLRIFQATAEFVPLSYLASFTQWVAMRVNDSTGAQSILSFANGPNALSQTFEILQLQIEPDSTLTATCPSSGQILANSGDLLFRFHTWNFFQINVQLSDVLVAGVAKVNIQCTVALNGTIVMTFNVTTSMGAAGLKNATSEVNRFQLLGGSYGAYTLDTLTAIGTYPHAGTPDAIAYQAPIEVDLLLNSGVIDAYQSAVEVDVLPDSAQVKIYQMVVEVDILALQRWNINES